MMRAAMSSLLLLPVILLVSACAVLDEEPDSDYLAIGQDRIYFEVSGQGFPLVLVSGGSGMDLRQWRSIAPALTSGFQVIAYDPRGIGASDNPTARYSDTADLALLLDHLDLDRVGLIGLSSAGGFVLEFAAREPDRVAGVVASAPFVPGFQFSQEMLDRLQVFSEAARKGREPFLDSMFEDPHFIPAPDNPEARSIARAIMAENFDKGSGFNPALQIPVEPPLIEQLSGIVSPVLLLAGELDHPEVLRRNRFLVEQIPAARTMVIPRSGHNVPLENPTAFLNAIRTFWQSIL
jgi:3-oxoadipate enol-lactonase